MLIYIYFFLKATRGPQYVWLLQEADCLTAGCRSQQCHEMLSLHFPLEFTNGYLGLQDQDNNVLSINSAVHDFYFFFINTFSTHFVPLEGIGNVVALQFVHTLPQRAGQTAGDSVCEHLVGQPRPSASSWLLNYKRDGLFVATSRSSDKKKKKLKNKNVNFL